MSDTHPRYIVAQRSTFPFGEWVIEYSVIDTGLNGNARTKCVVFEEDDAAGIAEALNFHHDLAVSPRDPSLHEARIEIDWHPSASVGEADAVKRLLESVCEGAMETLLEWGVVDPTISLSVDGAGVPKDVS